MMPKLKGGLEWKLEFTMRLGTPVLDHARPAPAGELRSPDMPQQQQPTSTPPYTPIRPSYPQHGTQSHRAR